MAALVCRSWRRARSAGAAWRAPAHGGQAHRSHFPGRATPSPAADSQRLSDSTGLTGNNAPPLFDYGASVRRELEQLVADFGDDDVETVRTIEVREQKWQVTPRKLLFHILLHEIRHWAQIALRGTPRRVPAARQSRSLFQHRASLIRGASPLQYSPTRSLASRSAGSLRSRGSLAHSFARRRVRLDFSIHVNRERHHHRAPVQDQLSVIAVDDGKIEGQCLHVRPLAGR